MPNGNAFSLGRKIEEQLLDRMGGLVIADAPTGLRLPVRRRDTGALVPDVPGLGLPPVSPELEEINRRVRQPVSGTSGGGASGGVSPGAPVSSGIPPAKPVSFPDFIAGLPPTEFEKVKREYEDELEREKQKINPRPSWGNFFRRTLQALGNVALTTQGDLDWGHIAGAVAGAALTQLPGKKFDELRRQQEEAEIQAQILEKYKPKFQIASATDEAQDRAIRRANEYQNILVREAVAAERQRANIVNERLKQRALEIRAEENQIKRFGINTKHEEFMARLQQVQSQIDTMLSLQKDKALGAQSQATLRAFEAQARSYRERGQLLQKQIQHYIQNNLLERARAMVSEKLLHGRDSALRFDPKSYTEQEEKALISQELSVLLVTDPLLLQLQQEADQVNQRLKQTEVELERFRRSLQAGSERPSAAMKADDRPLPPPVQQKRAAPETKVTPDVKVKPRIKPQ